MLSRYPTARRWVYAALGVTSLGIGATSAYLAAVGIEPPPVMLGVAAVWSFLAAATGYLAVSNTSTPPADVSKSGPEIDTSDVISMHSYGASPGSAAMSASSRHPTEHPTDSPPGEYSRPDPEAPDGWSVETGHDGVPDTPRRAINPTQGES